MRWHVHGTDSATGQPIVFAVNEIDATHAVQSAMSKRILVSHVVRGGLMGLANRESLKRSALPLLAAVVIVLAPIAGGLYYAQRSVTRDLRGSQGEQAQLAASLRQAESMLQTSQMKLAELQAASSGSSRQLLVELEAARQGLSTRETELAAARGKIILLEKDAGAAGTLKSDLDAARKNLADAQTKAKSLDVQVRDQRTKLASLEESERKLSTAEVLAGKLQTTNADLAKQIEVLKAQSLELAANTVAPVKPETPVETQAAVADARPLWGLRTGYDAASDFLVFYFGKESTTTSIAGGVHSITATLPANACTLHLKTDKQRVYAASLAASFSADAPKAKVTENMQILGKFAQTFAPGWKNSDEWLAAGMKALAGKDAADRIVLVGDDYKATLWNNKLGLYTLRIESPRGELDDQ